MNTYNYWCTNSDCTNPDKKRTFRITTTGDGKCQTCPYCSTELKRMGEVCNTFGRFSSSSPEQKKAMLRKRADDHSKTKNEQDRKAHLLRKAAG